MQDEIEISAHQRAKVRMEQLLSQAIEGVEKVKRTGPAVEPRTVSEASTVAAQAAGFVEACTLLAPELVVPEQARLDTLGAAVATMGEGFNGANRPPAPPRMADAPAAISEAPVASVGGDRRKSARADDNPRRVTIRRLLPDRRLTERRMVPDRRVVL